MSSEIHIVVVWPAAMPQLATIVDDLRESTEIVGAFEVRWRPERFAENLLRFYAYDVAIRDKTAVQHPEPFAAFVVRDTNPRYVVSQKSDGRTTVVNARLSAAKQRYRETTGPFAVHTSDDRRQATTDIFLMLGRTAASFSTEPAVEPSSALTAHDLDIVGADGWASVDDMLRAFGAVVPYVVLVDAAQDGHRVVRVLSDDELRARHTRGTGPLAEHGRAIDFALETIGDGQRDAVWQSAMLRDRIETDGKFVLTPEHQLTVALTSAMRSAEAGVSWNRVELEALAASAGAPPGDYGDVDFVVALLHDTERRTGWSLTGDAPRATRSMTARTYAGRLARRAGWSRAR